MSPRRFCLLAAAVLALGAMSAPSECIAQEPATGSTPYTMLLGVAQDAGYPQAGCQRGCCEPAWRNAKLRRYVACLAIVDPTTNGRWIIDCTPDFRDQLRMLDEAAAGGQAPGLDGILLTHAHVGHYAGLIHLGREVIGARQTPVYAMPRMRYFLEGNGPWDQLVKLRQITVQRMAAGQPLALNARISVTPILVPHRDEYSETVGFQIQGPSRKVLYIPDIDKWERWTTRIESLISDVDVAYLDATFFANGELPGRDMSKIPHPFVSESIERFKKLSQADRGKVRFLHFNHTNPLLRKESSAHQTVKSAGHAVAVQGERQSL